MRILDFQQSWYHTALPVMGMYDIRLKSDERKHIQNTPAEKAESFILISAHSIYIWTAEIVFIIHEVPGNTVFFNHFDTAVLASPAKLHFEITHMSHLLREFLRNRTELRNDYPNIMSFFCQDRGKRPDNIGKSACFDKRYRFTGGKKNFHPQQSSLINQITTFLAMTIG